MSRTPRLALVLVLLLLAGGTAQAMPLGAPLQSEPGGLFDAVWTWITGLFPGGEGQEPAAVWDKAGCEMDPNGLPLIIDLPGTQSNTSLADLDVIGL